MHPASTASANHDFHDEETRDHRFQEVSDSAIDQHAMMNRPSLVVFGQNSCGKTSFIQRFVGIGNILPADFGRDTARIVRLTYASAEQACFRLYDTNDMEPLQYESSLAHFFENQQEPDWNGIANALLPYVKRPRDIREDSTEFSIWAKSSIEISLPSDVLSLGIDVYDTPGFLSEDREQTLTDNLHQLVKRIRPILLFLYSNATIGDTDKSCFLAMKEALGSLERVSTFFLNTNADCTSIANDYGLDDDPDKVPMDLFLQTLHEKRQTCYKLLCKRREMAGEILGSLPESVDECSFFDICTIPGEYDLWEKYTNLINTGTFQRIVQFAVESYSAPTLTLAQDILTTVEDYFDLVASTTLRGPRQWDILEREAVAWGNKFFDEYEKIVPNLIDQLIGNILILFQELQPQIVRQAALINRRGDHIDTLLQDNAKTVRDYIRLAVQEQIVKVATNQVIIDRREEIKTLLSHHFEQSRRLRKNELLANAQRHVLGEITIEVLQKTTSFNNFLDNLIKIPMRCNRFWLSLPTRLSNYRKELYNQFVQSKISNHGDDVYKLLDAMDTYNTLSSEEGRRELATHCLTELAKEMKERRGRFRENLLAWVGQQRIAFNMRIQSNYEYVKVHLSNQRTVHELAMRFSASFARIECQLSAAIDLVKRKGKHPVIGEELGEGGFYRVHAAQWGNDNNLAVKRLRDPSDEHICMSVLEAHYHRIATLVGVNHVIPFLGIYENRIYNNHREFWLFMPKYPRSLRQYLRRHIHEMPLIRAVNFATTIASTLADLHRLEIVHRDIKSSNVMLDDDEQCYLIDFSTTKFGVFGKTILGTFPLAPEIARAYLDQSSGIAEYDGAAADIYSFGILLYEMLPKSTYEQPSIHTVSRFEECHHSIFRSSNDHRFYADLIVACLHSDPTKRPTAAEVFSRLQFLREKIQGKLCTMCQSRELEIRCIPCGHKIVCAQCWTTWFASFTGNAQCIICKAIVTGSRGQL